MISTPILEACRRFAASDSGAITVDWTVVGAAVVGLGLASVGAVRSGVVDLGFDIDASLSGSAVANLGALGGTGWEYPGLYSSKEWLDGPGGYIDQITRWNYSAAQLQSSYNTFAALAQRYIDQGNSRYAGLYADHLYAFEQILIGMGSTVPSGAPSLQSITDQIIAM